VSDRRGVSGDNEARVWCGGIQAKSALQVIVANSDFISYLKSIGLVTKKRLSWATVKAYDGAAQAAPLQR
jgi:hypothetical protein